MRSKTLDGVDQHELMERLHYDPETGDFTWLKSVALRIKPGDAAGYLDKRGYHKIKLNNSGYRAHRLAWLYMTGEWPDGEIDHINNIPSDNRWCNLRCATHRQNSCNTKLRVNNKTGYKGVSFNSRLRKYVAQLRRPSGNSHIGVFDTPEEAHAAYCQEAARRHKAFANYR